MGNIVKMTNFARGHAAATWAVAFLAISLFLTVPLTTPAVAQGIFDADLFDSEMIKAIRSGDNEALEGGLFATSPNDRSNGGTPAIVVAVESRNIDAVRILIEAGARVDNRARRSDRTALTVAAEMGEVAILRVLLENDADVDYPGEGSEVALIKAARNGHAEVLRALIEAGADLEEADLSGSSALRIAEQNRHREASQVLRDAGAR